MHCCSQEAKTPASRARPCQQATRWPQPQQRRWQRLDSHLFQHTARCRPYRCCQRRTHRWSQPHRLTLGPVQTGHQCAHLLAPVGAQAARRIQLTWCPATAAQHGVQVLRWEGLRDTLDFVTPSATRDRNSTVSGGCNISAVRLVVRAHLPLPHHACEHGATPLLG